MAEILFLNPYPEDASGINEGTMEPPLALAYLAAVTEARNIPARIIDANITRMKVVEVLEEIKKDKPAMLCVTVNLYTYQPVLRLVKEVKKLFPALPVVLGGPTPSSSPEKVMNDCPADAVAAGEGEETLGEILDNYLHKRPLFKGVSGVFYRENNVVAGNPPRGFMKDIDKIPFPAYHLFPGLGGYKTRAKKLPAFPLLSSRGCTYQCVFCSKDVFKNACRMRSPENIIKEIDMLVGKWGAKQIDVLDDNFTISKKRTERILDLLIERNYDLCVNLQSGVRIESLDENIIAKMARARIWKMPIGVESGDAAVLKGIKKQINLDRVLEVTRLAKKAGIMVYGFFMIGLPGDTPESMQRTIDFAVKMDPDIANFCITTPFPGTELYELIKREGRFLVNVADGVNAGFYANQVFYELGGLKKEAVLEYYKKAMKSFYFRPGKAVRLALSISSMAELKWFFNAGLSVIRNFGKKT